MTEKTKHYPQSAAKPDFPAMEQEVLQFWDADNTFQKSVDNRTGCDDFVFYDGPPFANGLPHYGHLLQSYIKDTVARFQTQNKKRVERRCGWDCHGLPAEMSAEKQLNVSGRKAIIDYGIDKFNDFCRKDVFKYAGIWVDTFKRIGRWVDFNNDYKTMNLSYMESVIHNFKTLYDKGLIYEDYRVMPYSWKAQSPLSNFEVNQPGCYRDKTDTAITIMFKLENGCHILAWTTTPWTLPSNLMLAVGADIEYTVMQEGNEQYILATALLGRYKQQLQHATAVKTMLGKELVGLSYTPLFPYFSHLKEKGAFKILAGDFVSTEDGTGVVHIAPGFGQEDFEVCRAADPSFPIVCPVDEAGCFTDEVPEYAGQQVFDTNEPVIARLKEAGVLVKKEQIVHSYPHCWRTDTPLIYRAMSSWFVRVSAIKEELLANNTQIHWIPEHLKEGRFGKGLETAPDWSISRNRFWGAPLPVWKSDNPAFPRIDVFGSIAEIKEKTGCEVTDLHRPMIDTVVYPNPDDPSGKTMMHRIDDVLDCWFESGSMPYGQIHYPFEHKDWFENHFPADFIVEALDQTRGWFYTLHVLGTILMHKPAYKTCLCTGLIMAENGQKLSKRLKNYPDPNDILKTMGSDSLRWWLLSSPVVKGGNVAVDLEGKEISKAARKAIIPLWNAYYFFTLYANAEGIKATEITSSPDILDTYILSKLKQAVQSIQGALADYNLNQATQAAEDFLDVLNNWYIRRSRARFWDGTQPTAFNTLYTVLITLCKALAPLLPFLTEFMYRNLTGPASVHLTDYPDVSALPTDNKLMAQMDFIRSISSTSKAIRETYKLRTRLPLKTMTIAGEKADTLTEFTDLLKDELNVKEVILTTNVSMLAEHFLYLKTPVIGKRLGQFMGAIMGAYKAQQWSVNPDGTLSIAGQILQPDEFELRLVLKEGQAGQALPDNTAVIQLDTTVYPDLEQEGIVRDFVRMVQQARKDMDLDVSDRIHLAVLADSPMLRDALTAHQSYIMEQTLTTQLDFVATAPENATTNELGDSSVSFEITVA